MPDVFERAVALVLELEGGLMDSSSDPSGPTKYGVNTRDHPGLDIRNLTREQATAIHRRESWEGPKIDRLPPAVAVAVFDGAVDQGPGTAVRMLQRCLGVEVDGILGPLTVAAAGMRPTGDLVGQYLAERGYRYAVTTGFVQFGRGWLRRLFSVHTVCLSVAEGRRD